MDPTWFERGVSPESVSVSLRHHVPEIRSGTVDLTGCRVTRLRSTEDGDQWTATYLLDVAGRDGTGSTITAHGTLVPAGATPPTAGSASRFGEGGWSCWLPDLRLHLHTWSADAELPGLHVITQEDSARSVLEQVLRAHRPAADAVRLRGCQATVMSYKAGLRATVCCDLDLAQAEAPSDWPRAVVAKVHRVDEGRACHDVLEALWASPLRTGKALRIAEPVGYVDSLGISVQSYLEHDRTLKDLLADSFSTPTDSEAVHDVIRATAVGLASLHTSGVTGGAVTTWADELATVEAKQAKLASVVPWLDGLTRDSLTRIGRAAARTPPDQPTAAHGSFRPAQVLLLPDGGLGLIDFDKAAQAEPAVDIALFLTKLRHSAVNKTGEAVGPDSTALEERSSRVDSVADAFIGAYQERARVTERRVRVWEALELCSLILSATKRVLPDRAATCAAMLQRHLVAHGL